MKIVNKKDVKLVQSPDYNSLFNRSTGYFMRWGKTFEDDPSFSPFGPELLDIEISTICHGASIGCKSCYKCNSPKGKNMSLDTFKNILAKVPKTVLQQIAFGIGDIDANPDLWDIMQHCRDNDIIPNITINGHRLTDNYVEKLASLTGAVAVSNYGRDTCYGTVKRLTDAGMKQVNIHQILAENTLDSCWELLKDMQEDSRLSKLNAAVFLLLKPKGRGTKQPQLKSLSLYRDLVTYALENELKIGFDSCSASGFMQAIGNTKYFNKALEQCVEPCESTCFSLYINVDGIVTPCSFSEGMPGIKSINLLETDDFLKDVWFASETTGFRNKLMKSEKETGCRQCPIYNLEMK